MSVDLGSRERKGWRRFHPLDKRWLTTVFCCLSVCQTKDIAKCVPKDPHSFPHRNTTINLHIKVFVWLGNWWGQSISLEKKLNIQDFTYCFFSVWKVEKVTVDGCIKNEKVERERSVNSKIYVFLTDVVWRPHYFLIKWNSGTQNTLKNLVEASRDRNERLFCLAKSLCRCQLFWIKERKSEILERNIYV